MSRFERHAVLAMGAALSAAPAIANNVQVNAIYDRMSAAYASGDAAALAKVYAKDALVFPSQANAPWLTGHKSIENGPGNFLATVRKQSGNLRIRFRVTERFKLTGSVVDAGIYRLSISDADGKESVRVGKFMTVAAPQSDGSWAFVADTDTPMPSEAWSRAVKTGSPKFDE